MPDIRVISPLEHANKRWFKPTNFSSVSKDRVVALGLSEIPKAMMCLPIGFIKTETSYLPAVIQGLVPGQNLLVTASGQWVADYIPVLYRSAPFKLAKNSNGQFVLCVDHDSGLVSDAAAGFPFFADEKNLSEDANAVATQLMQFETERARSIQICKLLDDCGIIEPWNIQLQRDEELIVVDGIYRINELKMNELPAETLAAIRNIGGLMVCYAQLFSMQHLQLLGTVAQRTHWANRVNAGAEKVVALNIVDDNGILSFANL